MVEDSDRTRVLLEAWSDGDHDALGELLQRDASWLQAQVRRRLGNELRARMETIDVVQDAAIEALRYMPRFVVADRRKFRALLAKIVENDLRDKNRRQRAECRAVQRERPIAATDTVLALDLPHKSVARPEQELARKEYEAWVRLGTQLLEDDDRLVLQMRQFEDRSFDEIGAALAINGNAARVRFSRAVVKLAGKIQELRGGKLADVLGESMSAE